MTSCPFASRQVNYWHALVRVNRSKVGALLGAIVHSWVGYVYYEFAAVQLGTIRRSLGFETHLASHQLLHRLSHRLRLMHDAEHLSANGHFHAESLRDSANRLRCKHSFDHLMNAVLRFLHGAAATQRQPQPAIAGLVVRTREYEVAESGQAHESLACRAELHPETHHFSEPARNQRDPSIGAEAHTIGNTRADCNDILDGAADFDTHDVGLHIGAEAGPRQPRGQRLGERRVARGNRHGGGQTRAYFLGEGWARQHGARPRAQDFTRDLMRQQSRGDLEALGRPGDARVLVQMRVDQ